MEETTKQKSENKKGAIGNEDTLSSAGKKPGKGRAVLLIILALAILGGGGAGFYWLDNTSRYFQTDNAKVTAKMYTITPASSGKLLEWTIRDGETVNKDQNLGRQEVLPYLVSPIHGTVVKNNGTEGQIVSPSTQLAIIADTDHPYIGVNIEETDINKIKVGQIVDVWIDAYGKQKFTGVVQEIDLTTQQYFSSSSSFSTSGSYTKVTQLIPIKVVIENPNQLPMAFGMNATVKIHLKDLLQDITPDATQDQTFKAQNVNLPVSVYTSSVEATDQISVLPDVGGKVTSVHFKVGQVVKEGDALFEIDSSDLDLQVQQASANLAPLEISSKQAAANLTRMQKLFAGGAISAVELEAAKAQAESAAAQLTSAQASLKLLQKKLDNCFVKAPMDGVVATKLVTLGSLASAQSPALTLVDISHVKVQIGVTENDIAKVKLGDTAQVQVQAVSANLAGLVESISPISNADNGLFTVEITLNNQDGQIKPGMKADVSFQEGVFNE